MFAHLLCPDMIFLSFVSCYMYTFGLNIDPHAAFVNFFFVFSSVSF